MVLHFAANCDNRVCARQLPLGVQDKQYNLPWSRCPECWGFIRADFKYCETCSEITATGKDSAELKRKSEEQSKILQLKLS